MTRIDAPLLLLWVSSACAGGSVSSPLGQPAPSLSSAAVPAAWTFHETEAALRRSIARRSAHPSDRRITTMYYVSDQAAAHQLSDWFRGRDGVGAVTRREGGSQTQIAGGGTGQAGAVRIAEQQWWELAVDSPVGWLGNREISAWLRLLRAVPADIRWRLGPSDVAEP